MSTTTTNKTTTTQIAGILLASGIGCVILGGLLLRTFDSDTPAPPAAAERLTVSVTNATGDSSATRRLVIWTEGIGDWSPPTDRWASSRSETLPTNSPKKMSIFPDGRSGEEISAAFLITGRQPQIRVKLAADGVQISGTGVDFLEQTTP